MGTTPTPLERRTRLPGDELLTGKPMTIDRATTLAAPPAAVWPWIVQLGKGRGGWYMPAAVETRLIPRKRRSATRILPEHQRLEPGDRVPDYGPGEPEFEVVQVEPPHLLVYRSERDRTSFTWVLKLDAAPDDSTRLHIRLRITTANRRRTAPLRKVGDLFDLATIALLFKGLEERVRPRG